MKGAQDAQEEKIRKIRKVEFWMLETNNKYMIEFLQKKEPSMRSSEYNQNIKSRKRNKKKKKTRKRKKILSI